MAELATAEPQTPPQQQQQPVPPVAPDDTAIHRSLQATLDVDPSLMKKMDDVLGPSSSAAPTPPSDPQPGMLAGLWQKTKDFVKTNLDPSAIAHGFSLQGRQEQAQSLLDTEKSVARGVVKGGNELSNTGVSLAVGAEKKTGLYKVGRTKDQQDAFLKWWDQPTAKANPLQFSEDQINKWVGPAAQGTLNSFVEQSSQFLTGFAATGEALPDLAATAGKTAKAAFNLAKAGITDATAFDPHIQRISNIVENHLPPDSKFHALTFLASKADDSDALGRFKASMEGLVLSSTIEGLSGGLSLLKAKGDPEAMAKVAAKTEKAVAAAKAEEVASVVPTADGQFAVVLNETPKVSKEQFQQRVTETTLDPAIAQQNEKRAAGPYKAGDPAVDEAYAVLNDKAATPEAKQAAQVKLDEAGAKGSKPYPEFKRGDPLPDEVKQRMFPEGPTYSSQGEAESSAAVLDNAAKNERLGAGAIDPEMVNGWKAALDHYTKNGDSRAALDILDQYGINMKYTQTPEELLNVVKSLVDTAPEASTVARGRPHTWAEVSQESSDLADAMGMHSDSFLRRSAQIFGSTQGLDTRMRAMKLVLWKHADEVSKMARAATINPDNALAQDQLAAGLDSMLELHAYYTGAKSEIGRALNVEKMPLGDAAVAAEKRAPAAEVSPEETQAAADATGGTPEKPVATPEATPGEPVTALDPNEGVQDLAGQKIDEINARMRAQADAEKGAGKTGGKGAQTIEGDAGGATLGPSQTPSNAGAAPYTDPYQFVNRAPPGRRATEGLTRDEIRSLANSVFLAEGDPNEILTLLRGPRRVFTPPPGVADKQSWFQKGWEFMHAYRMNAMLSGPKTQIANSISNTIMMFQRPLEYWMAGASTFNPELRQMGSDMLGGMSRDLGESWSAARKSFLKGDNVLDPMNSPIQGSTTSWGDASYLQKIFGAPSRMLMSADEFFKQINYRANLRAQILRQARSQGVSDAAELGDRLTSDMQFAFDPNGGAVNPVALQYAKVGTFTNDLEYGIGKWIQEGANQHPLIRTIFPFVRTTTQIFRNQWQRTPVLNMMNREFRADFMAGGERRALAIAKTEMGVAMYGTAGMLAATGQITGAGPSDPQLRQQMKATGWQPYSVKIPGTNRYVSYRRIDPTFAAFGLVADAVQIHSELSESDHQNMSSAIVASIMSNLGSKTYMQGVTDFADAMSSGDGNKVEKLLSATATSFEPNVLRQLNTDDTIRETRGLVDEFMSRTPGFSTKLEPRRNIFGEKILLPPGLVNRAFNPMTLSGPVEDGNVASELVKLGRAFSMPSTTKYNGQIDLTNRDLYDNGSHQSPYDRMLELMGKPKDGEPSLRGQMEEFVKSDDYKNASEDKYVNQGGEKWNLANGIIQGAQQKAWANTLEEYPKLQQAIAQTGELQGASLDGGSSAVKAALQHMDNVLVRLKRTPK